MDRAQSTLFPERLEDWIGEDNAVRVIDVFVEELDLAELGFSGVDPEATSCLRLSCSLRVRESLRQAGLPVAFDEPVSCGHVAKRLGLDPIANPEMGVHCEKEPAFLAFLVHP